MTTGTVQPPTEAMAPPDCVSIDPTAHLGHPPARTRMKTIDEMLHLALLTPDEHQQISHWIARSATPDEILAMPQPLWRAVERASEVMGIDQDLLRPPALDADGVGAG